MHPRKFNVIKIRGLCFLSEWFHFTHTRWRLRFKIGTSVRPLTVGTLGHLSRPGYKAGATDSRDHVHCCSVSKSVNVADQFLGSFLLYQGMTSSPAPGSRLADYFFVAGLGDSSVLETYEAVKQGRRQPTPAADDYYYYQQQQQRAATTTNDVQPSDRFNGNRFTSVPEGLSNSSTAHDAMLEHVKAVIDSFDKERDSARDAVIALHDHNYLKEKYGRERSASESTAFQSSSTTAYHHTNTKWQGGCKTDLLYFIVVQRGRERSYCIIVSSGAFSSQ